MTTIIVMIRKHFFQFLNNRSIKSVGRTHKYFSLKIIYIFLFAFFITYQANAQFTITENFKGAVSAAILFWEDLRIRLY
jgi:hypothetical protein